MEVWMINGLVTEIRWSLFLALFLVTHIGGKTMDSEKTFPI